MPNITPAEHRAKYAIYDNKRHSGNESAENIRVIAEEIKAAGLSPDFSRGDWKTDKTSDL